MFKYQPVLFWGSIAVILEAFLDNILPALTDQGIVVPEWASLAGLVGIIAVQVLRANNLTYTKAWLQETRTNFKPPVPTE